MGISKLASGFCNWMNKISPQSPENNQVIQYGLELLLDNIIKFSMIQLLGILLGKGIQTFIILFAFCGLRLHAGGKHAQTGLGCGLSMVLIWAVSLMADMNYTVSIPFLVCTYIISAAIIGFCAPRSINIEYFTSETKNKKKLYSILFLTLLMVSAVLCPDIRGLITYPIIIEVLTLLPKNKEKEKEKNEKRNYYEDSENINKNLS